MIMKQLTNNKHKISKSNKPSLKDKWIYCKECNKGRKLFDESHPICRTCYNAKKLKLSGNKTVDDFIREIQTSYNNQIGKMKFIPYNQYKNVEFIAEGG